MATQSPPAPFPLSDLGPYELSWVDLTDSHDSWKKHWVFWSRDDDELRQHHEIPLIFASNNGDPTMKEKIKCVLQELPLNLSWGPYLIQFWGLVNIGDSIYLTTCDQPFAISHRLDEEKGVEELCRYRKHCLEYLIAVYETSVEEGELGPPGRVFRSGSPEYIADVGHYSSKEYPQRDLAVKCLKNYYAFPVYQSPDYICVGVLEYVASLSVCFFPQIKFVDSLKKVDLTANSPLDLFNYRQSGSCHDREIDEIAKLLRVVCKTHQIRVAQTWIEANFKEQLRVLNQGPYNGRISWFMNPCQYCFIRKGHGVVGKAFSSQSACFCSDIKRLSITEYPFVPNARKYGFSSCFAICLQSSCSSSCIYTLEFLLPKKKRNSGDSRTLLHMIIETLKQHLQSSFRVASGQELGQNLVVEVIKVSSNDKFDSFEICHTSSIESTLQAIEAANRVRMTPPKGSFQQVDVAKNSAHDINLQQNVIVRSSPTHELVQNIVSITSRQPIEELDTAIPARDDASMEHNGNEATNLRKRGLAYTLESEFEITREVLEQYSTMKLVNAAKALGVSRSTLKRICRRYNICRWPPHKARKYNQAIDQQELAQPSIKNIEAHSTSVATRLLDDSSIMVKATYRDDIIKFQLLLSARKMDLEEKVAKRLILPVGSFRIKFLDEDNEWILVTGDEDLSISLRMLRSLGKTTVRMLVSQ